MKFILTRHGEKQKSDSKIYKDHFNIGLSDFGVSEIVALANHLKAKYPGLVGLQKVYCSNMSRSIQSAEILKKILEIKEISIHEELQEFFGTNNYTLPKEERRRLCIQCIIDKDRIEPDVGRSLNQAVATFKAKLIELASQSNDAYILIAGHGMINRYFIYTFAPELEPKPENTFDNGSKSGGYSVVEYENGKFRLLEYNLIPN